MKTFRQLQMQYGDTLQRWLAAQTRKERQALASELQALVIQATELINKRQKELECRLEEHRVVLARLEPQSVSRLEHCDK